jgi:type IV pilus assembly protein PilM
MAFFGLFNKKQGSVFGLDIGSSSIKAVQLRKDHGKAVLETYGELALGPYVGLEVGQATNLPADKIAETLKDLLHEAKVTSLDCGVSIPFSRSLLSLIQLPRRKDKEEQKTIIEFEARKYIPVPISEVQLDWYVVPDEEPTKSAENTKISVLLVAVHNDELTLLENIVKGNDLTASFYEIEIFSTIRAVVDEPVKPVMVLDIGASTTKAYIIEHGIVALSHTIPVGGQDATRAISAAMNVSIAEAEVMKKNVGLAEEDNTRKALENIFSHIFSEARRMLTQYEVAHQKPIAAIVLTGGGGVTRDLKKYAQSLFSVEVRVADPFAKTEAPAFMRPVLEEIGPEFAVAVGLALRKLEEIR